MYKRISCTDYDQFEIYAMRNTLLHIKYQDEEGQECQVQSRINSLQTRDKAEYLITEGELSIRLDRVLETKPVE